MSERSHSHSRREFLRATTGTVAGAMLANTLGAQSGERADRTIPIALVGCGGRGTGAAAQAMSTPGSTQLVALADVFPERMQRSVDGLTPGFGEKLNVPEDRRFAGTGGFRRAIDAVAPGGVVVLATPPAFRPQHVEYAVANGCHVFMEKSFAVDGPGIRRMLAAGEEATRRNLKIAGGLMSRHYGPLEEAIARIHDGAIGDIVHARAFRVHEPVPYAPRREGQSELAHQIENYSCFTWLNGSFVLDWLIHNIDVCCWAKGMWPVAAQGQGGRQVRRQPDQLFDHLNVEYTFPDGTLMTAQGRHMDGCWNFFGDVLHGTKGSAVLGEGIGKPQLYSGYRQQREDLIWKFKGQEPNPYQVEHDFLFQAIREDRPYNETERSAHAALTGILGRMALESGKQVTWDEALASNLELAPGLDELTMDDDPPVLPDAAGEYPVAMPGVTRAF